MARTQKIISGNAIKNKGMTVMNGGNVAASGPVTNSLGVTYLGYHSGLHGSAVPPAMTNEQISQMGVNAQSVMTGAFKPYTASGATYGKVNANQYLIRRYHQYTAGVANTLLNSGASDFGAGTSRKSIHHVTNLRGSFLQSFSYTTSAGRHTPTFSKTYNNTNVVEGTVGTINEYGNDNAAKPTIAIPGELVYMFGSLTPKQADYAARTTG